MASKRARRLEAKKRKAAAFLEVARLNDRDREDEDPSINKKVKQEESKSGSDDDQEKKATAPHPRHSDKPLLSGADYETLKAELRARKKALSSLPRFELKSRGHDASMDVSRSQRTPLLPSELQALLAYTMVGDRVPCCGPFTWCKVDKWNRLSGVICLVVEGISADDFEAGRDWEEVERVTRIFPHRLQFVSPARYGSTVAKDLSLLPVGSRKRKTMAKTFGGMEQLMLRGAAFRVNRAFFPMKKMKNEEEAEEDETVEKGDKKQQSEEECLKLRLLLSANQMVEENYPMPLPGPAQEKYRDYVLTKDEYEDVTARSPLYSVDCEMCMTTNRKMELTRICVVDADLKVVYHTLVKPEARITNYLTRFSGITEGMLVNVDTRLSDVQEALRSLLPPDAVLVGQSLYSDLHALRMMHPYVIDTSVIYNLSGVRRRKTKLAVLAARFLGRSIQQDGKLGHSPIEDAQAAMDLVKLKLEKGYEFGDVLLDGTVDSIQDLQKEDNDKSKEEREDYILATTLVEQIREGRKTARIVCQSGVASDYADIPGFDGSRGDGGGDVLEECEGGGSGRAARAAVTAAADHDMVFCHVRLPEEKGRRKRLGKAAKIAELLWGHVKAHGMLFTVWAGREDADAMVGIAMKKGPPPPAK